MDERTQCSLGMEITLSKWFFDGVMDKRNVLAISPQYFEITSGLGKWLYRAARKHAGGNGVNGFTIGLETLHQKSGSESSLPTFKRYILGLARENALPDISLEFLDKGSSRPKLKMVMRKYREASEEPGKEHFSSPPGNEKALAAFLRPSPAGKAPSEDFVDPRAVQRLLSSMGGHLREVLDDDPTLGIENPARASVRKAGAIAEEVLDPEIYQMIRRKCPGWDLDFLMGQFDSFLNLNPHEMPKNYSKRFLGFMKAHHERHKHTLPGF